MPKTLVHYADFFCGEGERIRRLALDYPKRKFLAVDRRKPLEQFPSNVVFEKLNLANDESLNHLKEKYKIKIINMDRPDLNFQEPSFFRMLKMHFAPKLLVVTTSNNSLSEAMRSAGFHVSNEGYHEIIPGEKNATEWIRDHYRHVKKFGKMYEEMDLNEKLLTFFASPEKE